MKELIERLRTPVSTNAPYEPHYTIPTKPIQLEAADALERLTETNKERLYGITCVNPSTK